MKFQELRLLVYTKYLDGLSIHRYLDTTEFYIAYNLCKDNDSKIKELEEKITSLNKDDVLEWVKKVLIEHKKYQHLDIRSLRNIASNLGVTSYSKCNKDQLIKIIEDLNECNRNQEMSE